MDNFIIENNFKNKGLNLRKCKNVINYQDKGTVLGHFRTSFGHFINFNKIILKIREIFKIF